MAKTTVVRAQAQGGDWEVLGADRGAGIWPENVELDWDEWGPSRASFSLRRDGSRPWPDLGAFTPVEVLVNGALVWDGRVAETPSRVAQKVMSVQCEGWQYHLDDDVFDAFYVHTDLTAWKDHRAWPSAQLGIGRAASGMNQTSGDGVLLFAVAAETQASGGQYCGAVLDLGSGGSAAAVSVDYETSANSSAMFLFVSGETAPDSSVWVGDNYASNLAGRTLNSLGASGTVSGIFPILGRRYLQIFMYWNGGTGAYGIEEWVKIKGLRIYSKAAYSVGDVSGLTATDVVLDGLSKGTSLLSTDRTRVRAEAVYARDSFSQTAGALTGKSADFGGVWTVAPTSDATDFSVTGGGIIQRAAASDTLGGRMVLMGTQTADDIELSMDLSITPSGSAGGQRMSFMVRYVDAQNWIRCGLDPFTGKIDIGALVANVFTSYANVFRLPPVVGSNQPIDLFGGVVVPWYTLRVKIDKAGKASAWFSEASIAGTGEPIWTVYVPPAAQGGPLATGKFGIVDLASLASSNTRYYDNFRADLGEGYGTRFRIPTFAPDGPQTTRQNWQAVDAYHDWIKKVDVGRVPVYRARPSAPVLEIGQWSAIDDEDASANSGADIYNKVIVTGATPDGQVVRATGTSAATSFGEPIMSITGAIRVDTGGSGAANTSDSMFKISNHVPYVVRLLAITTDLGGASSGGIDVYIGWNDFTAFNVWNTGDLVHIGNVQAPYSGAMKTAVWTPTSVPEGGRFSIGYSCAAGGTAGSTATLKADLVWGGTAADRRGFARAKVLPVSSPLPADLVAGTVIGSTWATSHRIAPFRGSAPVTGDDAVRLIDTGESVPLERLGSYTGELVRFADRADPDRGGWGRDGRIVAVNYSPSGETATLTIDNSRSSFEALMARLDILSR